MTRFGQFAQPHSTVRSCGLLVCALLLGLLGMHGLGPVPEAAPASGHDRMVSAVYTGVDVMASMPGACDHGEGGCQGHTDHADPTCASASLAGGPVVAPVFLPDMAACVGAADVPASSVVDLDGGRAPPSLSELQLLRI
ncbi:DUF6153 family protein [Streptomyces sporangiiformans]|uniref:DUF6153 family protein n=1 Tax=Streptomyces sporangiiformans TaxID=2315329 RepID=UPI001F09030E|nr:DUF6153 family protein [Streptomyces sporangiiformans]